MPKPEQLGLDLDEFPWLGTQPSFARTCALRRSGFIDSYRDLIINTTTHKKKVNKYDFKFDMYGSDGGCVAAESSSGTNEAPSIQWGYWFVILNQVRRCTTWFRHFRCLTLLLQIRHSKARVVTVLHYSLRLNFAVVPAHMYSGVTFKKNAHVTWSIPICPLRSHSMIHSKNNSYFVRIWPIFDIELICLFWPVSFVFTLNRR